ncbi:hypothetical protein NLX66_004295 [Acinetobacter baumannii]|nr:hypothetical protein [Acinetobacter baumannii]
MKKFIIFAVIGLLIALVVEQVFDKAMKSDEDTKYIEKILSDDSKLKKDYGEVESYSIVSKGGFLVHQVYLLITIIKSVFKRKIIAKLYFLIYLRMILEDY